MAIVKILTRHSPSYSSLIRYVLNDGKVDKYEVYTNNLRSNDIEGLVREFIENETFRRQSRSDQIFLYHEVLSFSKFEDNSIITKEMLDDLVYEYIRLRGNTGVMLGACHRDKDHVHCHFAVSALQYRTGKSFGLSKQHLQELKVAFQNYHKKHYPEIAKSSPAHGRGGLYLKNGQWHAQQRDSIKQTVQQLFDRSTSQKHFFELMRDEGLHHYERSGKPTGVLYEGTKHRFSKLLESREIEKLPVDRSEEHRALEEIRLIRGRQHEMDKNMEQRER